MQLDISKKLVGKELLNKLREKEPAALYNELDKIFQQDNFDSDLISVYLDVLEEKAPVIPPDFDSTNLKGKIDAECALSKSPYQDGESAQSSRRESVRIDLRKVALVPGGK